MKKNKPMRMASGLLAATLLTTSIVGGTFAKYITTDAAKDTARVAKFGVVVSAEGGLFGDSYYKSDATDGNKISTAAFSKTDESATADTDDAYIVAPGTTNDKGVTYTVKGNPEVSTKLTMDLPQDDSGKPYVNTDIFLKNKNYAIMAKVSVTDVVINADNCSQFFTLSGTTFTQVTASNLPTSGDVYKKIPMKMASSGDYYPIQWKVNNGAAITSVSALKTAVENALKGSAETHIPNQAWAGSAGDGLAKVTWSWAFSDATGGTNGEWADVAGTNGSVLSGWENTTTNDFSDTLLGDMIAKANSTTDIADYEIAVFESDSATTATKVEYAEVEAKSGSANKVYVAYTGTEPIVLLNSSDAPADNIVACLTVSFGERVTVEQVD